MSGHAGPCGASRGTAVADLAYVAAELHVLEIARHYFCAFARPEGHTWLSAISTALHLFDHEQGPHVAVAVLSAVQTMRRTRQSMFSFNTADCGECASFVTHHERAFMAALRATARGDGDAAAAHAAILCEGNDTRAFLRALNMLAERACLRDPASPARAELLSASDRRGRELT